MLLWTMICSVACDWLLPWKMICNIATDWMLPWLQAHGGMGVCQDTVLPKLWKRVRTIRIADGPDEVHMRSINRMEIQAQNRKSHL